MKKLFIAGIATLIAACALFGLWWFRNSRSLPLDTAYEAVVLDNGQVYYAKIDHLDSDFSILTDVYYVEHQVDAQTKGVKNVLIRRGSEWHGPNRTVVSTRHILMLEPVTAGSKVAELIAASKGKNP